MKCYINLIVTSLLVCSTIWSTYAALTPSQIDASFAKGRNTVNGYQANNNNAYQRKYYLQKPGSSMSHQMSTRADVPPDYGYPAYLFCAATLQLVDSGAVRKDETYKLRDENLQQSSEGKAAVSQCTKTVGAAPSCTKANVYSFDGSCNNQQRALLGRTNTCHRRLRDPAYDDGVDAPRMTSVLGGTLPNERIISLEAFNSILPRVLSDREFNHNRMSFGQFLAHDISLTPTTTIGGTNELPDCCNPNNQMSQCFQIRLPNPDQIYGNRQCMNFVRSEPCPQCMLGPREQMNGVTPYIDLSHIYGLTPQIARRLRTESGGRLDGRLFIGWNQRLHPVTRRDPYPLLMPPLQNTANDGCSLPGRPCFDGGDPTRVNQQIGISAWSTLWVRYHNFIADRVRFQNPTLGDERFYHIARRIAQAHFQLIIINEFLPGIVGNNLMTSHKLNIFGQTDYNPSLNPELWSEFATGAFRFGHSLIQHVFENRDNRNYAWNFDVPTRDAFSSIPRYYDTNTRFIVENFIAGMFRQPAKEISFSFADGVAHDTYRTINETFGMDLAALNIRRGRDHGLQPYYIYAQQYITQVKGYSVIIRTWEDIRPHWRTECYNTLRFIYRDVRDVDLYVGGLCEVPIQPGSVGPTFGSIIALQMRETIYGDRLFVSHKSAFSQRQYDELVKTTGLANVVCRSSENQEYAFIDAFRHNSRDTVKCSGIPLIDTTLFTNIGP